MKDKDTEEIENEEHIPNEKETSLMEEVLVNADDDKNLKHKASTIQTTLNMIKLFIGISILASPHAFSNSGVVGGILGISLATAMSICTVIMQSHASEKTGKTINSYSDLGYALYRGRGKLIVD
jgi:amino acid permease